jgi:hypothetical protein
VPRRRRTTTRGSAGGVGHRGSRRLRSIP